jgi:hypothetical protein
MGQRINPKLFRLKGKITQWQLHYPKTISLNLRITQFFKNKFPAVLLEEIHLVSNKLTIILNTKKINLLPSVHAQLKLITWFDKIFIKNSFQFNAAQLAQLIAKAYEKNKPTLHLINKYKNFKMKISGRIKGSSKAKRLIYINGVLPLQTIKSPIDYGCSITKTKHGILGIQIWLY